MITHDQNDRPEEKACTQKILTSLQLEYILLIEQTQQRKGKHKNIDVR